MQVWKKFASLFAGYQHAYGQFSVTHTEDRGKKSGNARTVRGTAGKEEWESHLSGGEIGLGMIPLLSDNRLSFAAIDIDQYDLDFDALAKKIRDHNFPLVICRSKSGGAHCYLFTAAPISAEDITRKLSSWSASLGYGGCEIFPKQTYRVDSQDTGNWINLPYYGGDETERYAVALPEGGDKVEKLSLEQFISLAERSKVSSNDLGLLKTPTELMTGEMAELFKDAPPCLLTYAAMGAIPEGNRNEEMYNMATFLKKKYNDDGKSDMWEEVFVKVNYELCKPPLPAKEISSIYKSVQRKDYDLKCNGPFCDRKKCCQAKYGIGTHQRAEGRPNVEQISKHEGDPVFWYLTIDNKRVVLDTDQLYSQDLFNKMCMEQVGRSPTSLSKAKWQKQLDEWVSQADVVPPTVGASRKDSLREYLESFCTATNRRARTLDEVAQNKPYRADGKIIFKSIAFQEYLTEKRFKFKSMQDILYLIRELTELKDKRIRASGKTHAVWEMQDIFEDVEEDGPIETAIDEEVF